MDTENDGWEKVTLPFKTWHFCLVSMYIYVSFCGGEITPVTHLLFGHLSGQLDPEPIRLHRIRHWILVGLASKIIIQKQVGSIPPRSLT